MQTLLLAPRSERRERGRQPRRQGAAAWPVLLLMALCVCAALPAQAQYLFGKNKVIYSSREWLVSQGEHVELFFYPEEEHIARYALAFADSVAVELEEIFRVESRELVPLVVYGSEHEFRETNVIPNILPESVGGFTDLIRGRVVVPSTGSLYRLRHVIRHELVHAYMLEKLAQVMSGHHQFSYHHPPLWFIEGMAEYYSVGPPDTEGEMLLREGILENSLPHLSQMWRIYGSYLMYKMGQSVVAFIDQNYSTEAVRGILESWWRGGSFEEILMHNLGMDLEELDRRWRTQMRRRYYPSVTERSPADEHGQQLIQERGLQVAPVALSDSTFLYLDTKSGRVDLAWARVPHDPRRRAEPEIVLKGGRGPDVESIPLFRSRLCAYAGTVLLSTRAGPRDELLFIDSESFEIFERFGVDSLIQIESPTLGPDGRILFSGIDPSGRRDLYLLSGQAGARRPEWRLQRLMNDDFNDRDPVWHPDGERFIFSSDRGFPLASPHRNLYELNLVTNELQRLTHGDWVDKEPAWHPEGHSYLYVSDRRGAWDVYMARGDRHQRQTACYGAVQTPSWNGDGFLATVYHESRFRIYRFPISEGGRITYHAAETATLADAASWQDPQRFLPSPVPYQRRWGLDFVRSGIVYDPEFGNAGGGQMGFTDLLGNHQVTFTLANASQTAGDFFKRMNVGVGYTNLSRRLNWSFAVFHLTSNFDANWDQYRIERRYGTLLSFRYPFNLFRRVEVTMTVRGIIQEDELSYRIRSPEAVLGSVFFSYIHDTVLWGFGGPYDGERVNFTLGYTSDFGAMGYGYTMMRVDSRKYWRLSRQGVFAMRFMGHFSTGEDPRFYHLGGPFELRGYPYRFFHSRGLLLSNQELRFPILNGVRIFAPYGGIDLPPVRGALFFDAAHLFYSFYSIPQSRLVGSLGAGLELALGMPIVLRWNAAWRTDFVSIADRPDYQFFFGWNF